MRIRTAQATTIVLFALVMGVLWGTWLSLSRTMDQLSAETVVAVGHQMIHNLGVPMAILLPLALVSALVTLARLWPQGRTAAFWWLAAGFALMVAALLVTLGSRSRSTTGSRTGRRPPAAGRHDVDGR